MADRQLLTLATRAVPRLAVRPENTALLVQDMQRYWVDPEGGYAAVARARGIINEYADYFRILEQMRGNVGALIDRAHQLEIPVVYTVFAYADPCDLSPLQAGMGVALEAASPEAEVIAELAPAPQDHIYARTGFSAFTSPDLDEFLARRRVENLIITGVLSEFGIWASALSAQDLGLRPLLVSDGCAGLTYESHRGVMARAPHGLTKVRSTGEVMCLLEGLETEGLVLI